ncbi:uncharacterized protein LOC120094817 isoform X5 [Rattus norvegicus]|uniref:uncharacterized protein LOC120094817 isoform X5 n=1 Tax=Rattus norvegicus TaxID=10116 RepID=UPI002FD7D4B9
MLRQAPQLRHGEHIVTANKGDKVSLCSPGCPERSCLEHVASNVYGPPASGSRVPGLNVACIRDIHTAWLCCLSFLSHWIAGCIDL